MSFKVLLVYCNSMMDNLIPVGLSSLIASLRGSGVEVELFDTTFYRTRKMSGDEMRVKNFQIPPFNYSDFGVNYKKTDIYADFESHINRFSPDLVAFSCVEPTYELALLLLSKIKKLKLKTVIGGIYSIFNYSRIIKNSGIDIVCLGEGETWFPELCRRIKQGLDYWKTPNFWVKKGGRLYKNHIAAIENAGELPRLDVSLYERERFYRPMAGKIYKMMPVEFSRGCPFSCTYCADHGLSVRFREKGTWLRSKPIDKIIEEIKFYISRYGINYFYFVSETFLAMADVRFNEFIDKYTAIKVPFWVNTRPETISEERIRKLKSAGCHRMSIGIEHGNEAFRKKMLNRNVSNETMLRAIGILNDSGLSYSVNNILGFPDETSELVFDTIELNRSVKSSSIGCYIFSPYHGTSLRDYCVRKGYISPETVAPDLNFTSILNMPSMSRRQIASLAKTFSMYVKFPKSRWPEIKEAESSAPSGRRIFEKLGREFLGTFYGKS